MIHYWRITFLTANQTKRTVWAKRYVNHGNGRITFRVVNKQGDEPEPAELVIASHLDIIRYSEAVINNHYAELEVVTRGTRR